jgi:fructose-1,6-bisphosphatase/inositol monophosphatase family enzyme
MTPDPEAVTALLRRAASEIILPRFRKLERHDIREKGPGDLVTIADTEAESMLTPALRQLVPGSVVVGEEAVAADNGVLDRLLGTDAVWLIDPVDGTFNFAHGNPGFAIIVAFVDRGNVRAGWIHEPIEGETVWAAAGAGTWRGRRRLTVPEAPPVQDMIGVVSGRLPNGARARDALQSSGMRGPFVNIRCAGRTYTGLADGRFHYAYFSRSKPWDHAAGWLIHREAGGQGAFLDGEAYTPVRANHPILSAPDRARWKQLESLMV